MLLSRPWEELLSMLSSAAGVEEAAVHAGAVWHWV
jgi:hypothetical protein